MAKGPAIDPNELVKRLALRNDSIAEQVFSVVKRAIESDEKRDASLNQKATALLSVTGLSLTLAFTFGGLLVQRAELAVRLGPGWMLGLVVVPYGVAILCGLAASGFALAALRVRSIYREVDPQEVFGPVLTESDEKGDPTKYKRHLTAHLWLVYEKNYENHEQKACIIKWGQYAFVAFIFALLPIGVAMTCTIAQAPADTLGQSPPLPAVAQSAPATSNAPPAPAGASPAPPPASVAAPQPPPAPLPVPSAGRSMTASQHPPTAPRHGSHRP